MSESRVFLQDGQPFNNREWLRRDVVWAYLMTPYTRQLSGWVDVEGSQAKHLRTGWANITTSQAHHNGNVSRQYIYEQLDDKEAKALSFFNQGKNIAGMTSSAALFKACMGRTGNGAHVNVLQIHAETVDKVLGKGGSQTAEHDSYSYQECTRLATINSTAESGSFGVNHRYLRAARIMTNLAHDEAALWVEAAQQNVDQSLPVLTIHNGGHPRSAGPRVEMLQPIFEQIINSGEFQALS